MFIKYTFIKLRVYTHDLQLYSSDDIFPDIWTRVRTTLLFYFIASDS